MAGNMDQELSEEIHHTFEDIYASSKALRSIK